MKEQTEALATNNSGGFLQIIDRLVGSGELTTEKVTVLERLLAMQMTVREEERKAAYATAMNALQAEIPQIQKDGKIIVGGSTRSTYARLEDIDAVVRPLLAKYGFSLSFDEEQNDGKEFVCACKLLHKDGHFEIKRMSLPLDAGPGRTSIQARGSTQHYAQRYLLKMHLNMIERGADDDGQGAPGFITDKQTAELQAIMDKIADFNMPGFLKFMAIESLSKIPARQFPKALESLQNKLRSQK